MGCCVSTHKNKTTPKNLAHQNNNFPCVSKSPPRAEEEAVKEVLSETPKPKPFFRPDSPARDLIQEDGPTKNNILMLTPKKPVSDPARYHDPCTTPEEEISEVVSEMCSFSESIDVSTNTLKDDDNYVYTTKENASSVSVVDPNNNQRVFRSLPQGYNSNFLLHHQQHFINNNNIDKGNINKNQGRSPARRRPEPSPPRRRNPGQGGTRRSQSPGVRANVGRSPSGRRNGPSPGRVRMVNGPGPGLEDSRKKMEVNEEELRRESEEWQGPKESLENPLVSLECFIFL